MIRKIWQVVLSALFCSLFPLFASANCDIFHGFWESYDGKTKICHGKLLTQDSHWRIHSILCRGEKLRIISSNGSKIFITGFPPVHRQVGDVITLFNGYESLALYYNKQDCKAGNATS